MAWKGSIKPSEWARQTKQRIDAVSRSAVQGMADEMARGRNSGGLVPVKTGNLVRSLLGQPGSMPTTKDGPFPGQDIGPALLAWDVGQEPFYIGYQAKYARRQNYGFVGQDSLGRNYNQAGFGFVEAAIAKWPQIVTRAAIDIRTGAGLSSTNIARQMRG